MDKTSISVSAGCRSPGGPTRVAVVGCGAVARQFHIPVLAGHEGVRLAAFVDRDLGGARALARAYGVDRVVADVSELGEGEVDAALVATPAAHHAPGSIALMRRGIHVLVEKPMALTASDAAEMVREADAAGVVLAVGLFRRLLQSSRMMRALVDGRAMGPPTGFSVRSGAFYGWPAATLGNMRKDLAGGGVLMDMGPHVLDQLLFFLPGPAEVLEYRDNSLGGIESSCRIRLGIVHEGRPLEGCIELSRTHKRRGGYRIECERGVLGLPLGENDHVSVVPHELDLVDRVSGRARDYRMQAGWADTSPQIGFAAFREETDDWLRAIREGRPPQLSGRSALQAVELIEECYRRARPLREPWVEEGLRRSGSARPGGRGGLGPEAANGAPVAAPPRVPDRGRVLVTGATGFIGCRVAEILHFREGWQVRALVHNPGSAARLARLPVELIQGDLRSEADMGRAVEGCDAVVHCAVGTAYGRRREVFAVTVDGTRHLADAALAAGVRRFVHVSTIAVHGNDATGVIDEETPVRPGGGEYNESKAAAEQAVLRAVRDGLPAVTLRLANIYGPFGRTFTIDPIERIAAGTFLLVGGSGAPSNSVYVDDVAEAIACSLGPLGEGAIGQTFAIGSDDDLTWEQFYGYFADGLGVPLRMAPAEGRDGHRRRARGPGRWGRAWARGCFEIAKSPESRALVRRALATDPVGWLPRRLLEAPGVEGRLRKLLNLDEPLTYRPSPAGGGGEMVRRPRAVLVRTDKARALLGYRPAVTRGRAMELTLEWVRDALVSPIGRGRVEAKVEV